MRSNFRPLTALPLAVLVACGSPVRLDECQSSDSSLECSSCCDQFGYGDRPSAFTSATGRCTCYEERSAGSESEGNGGRDNPPVSGADSRCWDFFTGVLNAECEGVDIAPGVNTCEANFCQDAGIAANRVDAECTAFLTCWDGYATCMSGCSEDLSAIDRCNTELYACVDASQ